MEGNAPGKSKWIKAMELDSRFKKLIDRVYPRVEKHWGDIDDTAAVNQLKVLEAFRKERVNEEDFRDSSGYGYNDMGREKLENLFAYVFKGEKALVRPQLLSGTHALTVALFGLLRPGDRLLSLTGPPYDTLLNIIGDSGEASSSVTSGSGTLTEWGIKYQNLPLDDNGQPDTGKIPSYLNQKIKVAFIQKSPGYSSLRPALTVPQIKKLVEEVRRHSPDTIILVDNCYGELVEEEEPLEAGADVVAGSLIKNAGGGLAPTGGYVAGRSDCLNMIAARYSAPGLEDKLGSMSEKRQFFMGLFNAPQLVANSLKISTWASILLQEMGYPPQPAPGERRSDLVQKLKLFTPDNVKLFIQTIQKYSPVDSFVTPEPSELPGYTDPVIMGAGTFIQGSSSELSCDAPMREPYTAFLQGGLTLYHGLIAVTKAAEALYYRGDAPG